MSHFEHGRLCELETGVHRLVAPNPGVMTGPGTNTYLLGERDITVVDPGPLMAEHVEAILRAADELGGRIARIVTTHTHKDHSPAAALLRERLSDAVELVGAAIDDDGFQDASFAPDMAPEHGIDIAIEGGQLTALHTPGHVGNHFCYLHRASGLLFTGDHVMQGSTVVIIPPAGDMGHYIESLQLMRRYPLAALAPGHGDLIREPEKEIDWLIAHRLQREAKVVDKLQHCQPADLETLVVPVYDDVDPALHPVAQFSLWAHLLKLQREGRVGEHHGRWSLL